MKYQTPGLVQKCITCANHIKCMYEIATHTHQPCGHCKSVSFEALRTMVPNHPEDRGTQRPDLETWRTTQSKEKFQAANIYTLSRKRFVRELGQAKYFARVSIPSMSYRTTKFNYMYIIHFFSYLLNATRRIFSKV